MSIVLYLIYILDTRISMKEYWIEHSQNASNEDMILDENNNGLAMLDRDEVFKILPSLRGMDIIEVGAGIGRLTQFIAPICKSLKVVDFIEEFIKKVY